MARDRRDRVARRAAARTRRNRARGVSSKDRPYH
jgi:hypothetical protein